MNCLQFIAVFFSKKVEKEIDVGIILSPKVCIDIFNQWHWLGEGLTALLKMIQGK